MHTDMNVCNCVTAALSPHLQRPHKKRYCIPSQTLVVDFQRENPGFNIICTTKGFWVLNINTVCTTC